MGEEPQLEFFADTVWTSYSYGKNATYPKGHHGNAILSRFPITDNFNVDISTNTIEKRGLLRTQIDLKNPGSSPLHVYCTHINLLEQSRLLQCSKIIKEITHHSPSNQPVILCGDFNDWTQSCHDLFLHNGFSEVHEIIKGSCARTFPSFFPLLNLDRIYVRNVKPLNVEVHKINLSDHAALFAEIALDT